MNKKDWIMILILMKENWGWEQTSKILTSFLVGVGEMYEENIEIICHPWVSWSDEWPHMNLSGSERSQWRSHPDQNPGNLDLQQWWSQDLRSSWLVRRGPWPGRGDRAGCWLCGGPLHNVEGRWLTREDLAGQKALAKGHHVQGIVWGLNQCPH